jgi:hypothetical protein
MQTFLPYKDYTKTAKCLDMKRLGKQRVECLQIMKALCFDSYGWKNHPAVKMWVGYETGLLRYSNKICDEWVARGYKDTCKDKIEAIYSSWIAKKLAKNEDINLEDPDWLGNTTLHDSHKSSLLRKKYEWYIQFGWDIPIDLPYYWPVETPKTA